MTPFLEMASLCLASWILYLNIEVSLPEPHIGAAIDPLHADPACPTVTSHETLVVDIAEVHPSRHRAELTLL